MENENFLKDNGEVSEVQLKKLIEIARNLRQVFKEKLLIDEKKLAEAKQFLAMVLKHLIKNRHKTEIDLTLIEFIEEVLGIKKEKLKEEENYQEKENKRVKEEFKKHRYRMAMYEIYKVLNPAQLAGETKLDNFLNNLMTRGLAVAQKYQGGEFTKLFSAKDMEYISSYRHIIKEMLHEAQQGKNIEGLQR